MTDQQPSRPWLPEEMYLMNARGLGREGLPATGPRVVASIPTAKEQRDMEWRSTEKWTRETIREIMRLGFEVDNVTPDLDSRDPGSTRVYLSGVGRSGMFLVLRACSDSQDGILIKRVTFGTQSWTARQAALWLRKRAAR